MSLLYDIKIFQEAQFSFWKFKTPNDAVWVNINNIISMLNNENYNVEFYNGVVEERLDDNNIRRYVNYSNFMPHPDIDPGETMFINSEGLRKLILEHVYLEHVEWLMKEIFNENIQPDDMVHELEMMQIFQEFDLLFNEKKRGHDPSFFVKSFMSIWTRLINLGNYIPWIKNLANDLSENEFNNSYKIYTTYSDQFLRYNIIVIITQIFMYFNGKTSFEQIENSKSNQMFYVLKHKNPQNSPFYALSMKNLITPNRRNVKSSEKDLMERKVTACKMMQLSKNGRENVDYVKLIKLGDPLSLNASNAGLEYSIMERAIQSHSQLFLELSNTEICGTHGTYAKIIPDYE